MLPLGSARGSAARVRRRARRAPARGTRSRAVARPPRAGVARVERGALRIRRRRSRARVGRGARLGRARVSSLLPLRRTAHRAAARRRLAAASGGGAGPGRSRSSTPASRWGSRSRCPSTESSRAATFRRRRITSSSCRPDWSRLRATRSARQRWSSSRRRRFAAGRSETLSSCSASRSRRPEPLLRDSAWQEPQPSLLQRFSSCTRALLRLRADLRHYLHLTHSL